MLHDEQCELGRETLFYSQSEGPSCHCASRAYQRDPLPESAAMVKAREVVDDVSTNLRMALASYITDLRLVDSTMTPHRVLL